jgi:hypothetical protein
MERYTLGQKVRLGEIGGKPVPAACRFEVIRPDGKLVTRDWDKHAFQLKVSQPGIWTWKMYVRDGNATTFESGQFEVFPGGKDKAHSPSGGRAGWLARRFGGKGDG